MVCSQVFQGDAPPGYVNIKYLEKALNTYSGDKQAVTDGIDLLMQVPAACCMLLLADTCILPTAACMLLPISLLVVLAGCCWLYTDACILPAAGCMLAVYCLVPVCCCLYAACLMDVLIAVAVVPIAVAVVLMAVWQVDPDGTGYINFQEYVDMMTAK